MCIRDRNETVDDAGGTGTDECRGPFFHGGG
jgi:hypothetical protein